ncbi:hypothetical protein [Paracoccus saliphilus]|uniref:Ribbon-helix-helix protein, copG family n=1 Tax=Paracoccus saliphilus TaxID=405559 RepID=A0AA46A655_9RHOB|nr:hypothetical protein [Paracoccus saliphilus]WCR05452.1 hypothetical protein JHX88_15355 [Paracoccus saliphilus]SIS92727.1 hypothetical protein SAMN05421772_10921 [Paracoccus saliphilus]
MSEKKKMGRPRTDTEPVMIRMSQDMIRAIDDRRREEPDLPTRPEMIRRLLADALQMSGDD